MFLKDGTNVQWETVPGDRTSHTKCPVASTRTVLTDRKVEVEAEHDVREHQWSVLDDVVVSLVVNVRHLRCGD